MVIDDVLYTPAPLPSCGPRDHPASIIELAILEQNWLFPCRQLSVRKCERIFEELAF